MVLTRLIGAALVGMLLFPPMQTPVIADEIGTVTKLPIPRYVSLRSSKINVRRGPGLDYRKDWVFRRAGWPVKVVDEYGDWRRVIDVDEAGGWVFHAMLTGRRTVLVTGDTVFLREEPRVTAAATAEVERGVVARLRRCDATWCELEKDGYRGWVAKSEIWGVESDEISAD
ncbi:MAG: SH3 domain-containing protein [Pseudomonadota bacterium]